MTAAETQILLNKLQSSIKQLELTNKGALTALEFRLDAILQAILGTGFEVMKVVSVDKIISDAEEARKLVD